MRYRTSLVGCIVAASVAAIVTGCGDDGDDTAAAGPPWCLADIELPDDPDAIGAALAAMPSEHNGAQGELETSNERIELFYDEPLDGEPSVHVFSIDALEGAFPEAGELTAFAVTEIVLEAGVEPVDPGGVTGELDQISMDPSAELVWADVDELELGTLGWVHWFNEQRLHGHCHDVLPAEFESAFCAGRQTTQPGLETQTAESPSDPAVGS